eukprot:3131558-Ditylum_brightwellii.AAC.1
MGTFSAVSLQLSRCGKQCGQNVVSKNTYAQQPRYVFKGDSSFSSVPIVESICKKGGAYVGIVKTAHSLYPKKDIKDMMNTFPGGADLVYGVIQQ